LPKLGPQAACLDTDDRIDARIKRRWAVVDFHADRVFADAARASSEGLLHRPPQETTDALGLGEDLARQDLGEMSVNDRGGRARRDARGHVTGSRASGGFPTHHSGTPCSTF